MIIVWGNSTLLQKVLFPGKISLHRFLGNQQCIIIKNFTSCPAINRYVRVLSKW
jgi:hypothetical protein